MFGFTLCFTLFAFLLAVPDIAYYVMRAFVRLLIKGNLLTYTSLDCLKNPTSLIIYHCCVAIRIIHLSGHLSVSEANVPANCQKLKSKSVSQNCTCHTIYGFII